jgi:hypothetical protein
LHIKLPPLRQSNSAKENIECDKLHRTEKAVVRSLHLVNQIQILTQRLRADISQKAGQAPKLRKPVAATSHGANIVLLPNISNDSKNLVVKLSIYLTAK